MGASRVDAVRANRPAVAGTVALLAETQPWTTEWLHSAAFRPVVKPNDATRTAEPLGMRSRTGSALREEATLGRMRTIGWKFAERSRLKIPSGKRTHGNRPCIVFRGTFLRIEVGVPEVGLGGPGGRVRALRFDALRACLMRTAGHRRHGGGRSQNFRIARDHEFEQVRLNLDGAARAHPVETVRENAGANGEESSRQTSGNTWPAGTACGSAGDSEKRRLAPRPAPVRRAHLVRLLSHCRNRSCRVIDMGSVARAVGGLRRDCHAGINSVRGTQGCCPDSARGPHAEWGRSANTGCRAGEAMRGRRAKSQVRAGAEGKLSSRRSSGASSR